MSNNEDILEELLETGKCEEHPDLTPAMLCEDFLMFNLHNEEFLTDLFSVLMGEMQNEDVILNDLTETVDRFLAKE